MEKLLTQIKPVSNWSNNTAIRPYCPVVTLKTATQKALSPVVYWPACSHALIVEAWARMHDALPAAYRADITTHTLAIIAYTIMGFDIKDSLLSSLSSQGETIPSPPFC